MPKKCCAAFIPSGMQATLRTCHKLFFQGTLNFKAVRYVISAVEMVLMQVNPHSIQEDYHSVLEPCLL